MIETTLCLLRKDNKILLPRKKRGVGAGKKIKAYFNFDEEWNILEQKIVEE